ncbi:haloacid dehalogenase type II [Neorhizobium sp. Rsf11]|uniref:(S)-2-haloacid dehalogenase n=2 Tax=Neorhizobium TaxID=1525371 RepID=A0ABV0MC79_9HYPH|nr:haloacid dehalogenase type II [Neorhizobium petrolearium]MCC2613724.1 haloacid dehalogenase type II [Neorhizobium petrolearium]WGI72036.1 haloacid dehalogenase type II [Neorhizobium petrolearium]
MTKTFVFDAYGTLFDVQSIGSATEEAFPGYGHYITQIWRMKQLEYSWLTTLMGRNEDFWTITLDALEYTLKTLGLKLPPQRLETLAATFNELSDYEDAETCLTQLATHRLAILSNGTKNMLTKLVGNSALNNHLHHILSVEESKVFKPDPRAYQLIIDRLAATREEVIFVSSNGFDIAGAKSFGFTVVRVERVSSEHLTRDLVNAAAVNFGPTEIFKAMRTQEEQLQLKPDFTIPNLASLPKLFSEPSVPIEGPEALDQSGN